MSSDLGVCASCGEPLGHDFASLIWFVKTVAHVKALCVPCASEEPE